MADGAAVVRDVAEWLGLDPDRLPATGLRSENRTTGFRHARLQRVALWGNDTAERWLRRVPGVKRRLRSVYFRINGTERRRARRCPTRREPSSRAGSRSRTRGSPRCSTTPGSTGPAWLT